MPHRTLLGKKAFLNSTLNCSHPYIKLLLLPSKHGHFREVQHDIFHLVLVVFHFVQKKFSTSCTSQAPMNNSGLRGLILASMSQLYIADPSISMLFLSTSISAFMVSLIFYAFTSRNSKKVMIMYPHLIFCMLMLMCFQLFAYVVILFKSLKHVIVLV